MSLVFQFDIIKIQNSGSKREDALKKATVLEVLLTNITERRVSIVHFTMFLELFLGLEDDLAMAVTAGKLSLLKRLVGIQVC